MAKSKNTARARKPAADKNTDADRDGNDHQPAYFLSLSLENIRCFGPKQTLDLSDGDGKPARWSVILGINGTGKTTILQSLVGFESLPRSEPFEGFSRYRLFNYFKDHAFQRTEGQRKGLLGIKLLVSPSLTGSAASTAEIQIEVESHRARSTLIAPSPNYVGNCLWCCAYGAGRRMGTVSLSDHSDEPTATLFSDQAELRNPEEWLLRLDYAARRESVLQNSQRQRLAQVKELLLSVLPEEVDDIRLIVGPGTNPTARAEFKTPYGWVPLRQLGYGYQTLITWVTDLANRMVERYPDSSDPLAEPAVVLVDEIDLHLHPVWQRQIMDFLTKRFPNTQFIVTAHSPLVVQAAADANLAVLRREADHVVIDNDVDDIRNWRVDQILTSDLFGLTTARPPQIERLLVERGKILEKAALTTNDERRLEEIETEIGNLPFGETSQERNEREQIRKTLDLLLKKRHSSK